MIQRLTDGAANHGGQELFAAYVAHELRTPIALQRAVAEAALTDPHADTAVLRAMAQDVVASCEQQQRLIDALLYLARGQGGLIRHEPADLASITSRQLRTQERSTLESILSLESAQTTGDPDLIERLAASFSNAIRYNVAGGRIEVARASKPNMPFSPSLIAGSAFSTRSSFASFSRSNDSLRNPPAAPMVSLSASPSSKPSPTPTTQSSPPTPDRTAASKSTSAFHSTRTQSRPVR
jgi:hypothetical protein